MTTTRSHIVDTLTARAFIISVIVFVLLAPLPAALGFIVGTREVVVALVAAVIGWEVIRGRHRGSASSSSHG